MKKKKQWGGKWTEEKLDAFEMATGFLSKQRCRMFCSTIIILKQWIQ
jgi:hypothetical protein